MNVINFFIQLQSQFRILHWQTTSFARHKAYELTYDSVVELADRFIEAYQGKYGRLKADKTVEFANINDDTLDGFLDEALKTLLDDKALGIEEKDVDLKTIRDEVVEALNKLKYLLTLS